MAKENKKKKKKNKKDKQSVQQTSSQEHLMQIEAAEQRDVGTTHGLISRSINMVLAQGIIDCRKKDGDPNIDINLKAIDTAIRWVSYNGQKTKDTGIEAVANNLSEIDKIRQEQASKAKKLKQDTDSRQRLN